MTTIIYDREKEYDENPELAEVVSTLPVAVSLFAIVESEVDSEVATCDSRHHSEGQSEAYWGCSRNTEHLPPHIAIDEEKVLMAWTDE